MKSRLSASLVAGACTVCIAASSGTVAPHTVAAPPAASAVAVVSARYELTAATTPLTAANAVVLADLLNIAGLPLRNITTTINAASALTAILFLPNTIYTLSVTGKSDQIPAAIQAAITAEKAAFKTFAQLPKSIIATDVAAFQKLFADLASPAPALATKSVKEAAVTSAATPAVTHNQQVLADLLNVAGLPFRNVTTVINAGSALTAILFVPNTIYGLIIAGKSDQIPAAIQTAVTTEKAAFKTFAQLPKTIAATDAAAIKKLFADFKPAVSIESKPALTSTSKSPLALTSGTPTDATTTDPAPKTPVRHLFDHSTKTSSKKSATKTPDPSSDTTTTTTSAATTSSKSSKSTTSKDNGGGYVGRHRAKVKASTGAGDAS